MRIVGITGCFRRPAVVALPPIKGGIVVPGEFSWERCLTGSVERLALKCC
jgi:hypothetical protein